MAGLLNSQQNIKVEDTRLEKDSPEIREIKLKQLPDSNCGLGEFFFKNKQPQLRAS